MKVYHNPQKKDWHHILRRPDYDTLELESIVGGIVDAVKRRGDKALREYSSKFDKVDVDNFLVGEEEIRYAKDFLDKDLKVAICQAHNNIRKFHKSHVETVSPIETMPGVKCWRKSVAIEKVGLYIPGGSAPLFSTVLMLATPAKIAGCREIVLCTPPDKNGSIHPAILFSADIVGVTKIFKVGGAQAVAAMALGTESIPKVYKILGPGNRYVTAAKQMITKFGVAIDMPAGPSEVLVLADETSIPEFVAADLLAQAEHGSDSQVVLIAKTKSIAIRVEEALTRQIKVLPRRDIAQKSLKNSIFIVEENLDVAREIINSYAPEHLILSIKNPEKFAETIINAGSVFIGNFTPESVGDYASGTNHTLPTNGYAVAYSGVSLDTFVKKITFQKLTERGLESIGHLVEKMAESEQLTAHKNAVTLRLNHLKSKP